MIGIALIMALGIMEMGCSPITNPFPADGDLNAIIPDYLDTHHTETSPKKDYHKMSPNSTIQATAIQLQSSSQYDKDDLQCVDSESVEFKLRWSNTVGSAVYAPPVIFPSANSDNKQIFVSNYYTTVELLDGDGYKPWGWPLSFEGSSFHASPLLHDVDEDGVVDVGVVDTNGNLFWIATGGNVGDQYLEDYHIQIPKLKVKRDWTKGLDPQFSDTQVMESLSLFDRHHRGVGEGKGSENPIGGEDVKLSRPKLKVDGLKTVAGDVSREQAHSVGAPRRRLLEEEREAVDGLEVGGEVEGEGSSNDADAAKPSSGEGEGKDTDSLVEGEGEDMDAVLPPVASRGLGDDDGSLLYGYGHEPREGSLDHGYAPLKGRGRAFSGDDGFSGYYSGQRYGGGMYNDSDFV
jgi:hypothetical protein